MHELYYWLERDIRRKSVADAKSNIENVDPTEFIKVTNYGVKP